jgi:hypothetical protein
MSLTALTRREAAIFECVCDTVVAPEPVLPPVRETDAVEFFDSWLARAPRPNRVALRGLLNAAELVPRLRGFRRGLRTLPEPERARLLFELEKAPRPRVRQLVKLLRSMTLMSYYGDDGVMRRLGYDPEARLRRARALRAREGRP